MTIQTINNKLLIDMDDIDENKTKYSQLDKVTVLLKTRHKMFLDALSKQIMKKRVPKKDSERITANTLIRCLIEYLEINHKHVDWSNIHNENELKDLLEKSIT
jgi:hypothetical protein